MNRQNKSKKDAKKTNFLSSKKLLFLETILLVVLVSLAFSQSLNPGSVKSAKIENVVPSATVQPSLTPQVETPYTSGKQVSVPILMYHYIGKNPNPADTMRDNLSVDPELFDAQMNYLAQNGYSPITLDTLLAGLSGISILPPKPIVITFDDGYIDLYYNAFPILKKYQFKAVAFIPTGLIGNKYYATWGQIQEMQQSGLVKMEAHTVNHVSLINVPHEQQLFEITESKKTLESKLGIPVNFMAYPYGTSNQEVWELVKKAGFLGAAGTWHGDIISEGTIFDMPRIKISGGITVATFASKI